MIDHSLYMRFPNGLSKALTLSYDDGVTEDIRLIEIMNRYGLKGTFNICGGQYPEEGEPHNSTRTWGHRLTYRAATELYKNSGQEIALHANTHPRLEKLPTAQVAYEVMKCRENLEQQFDRIVRGMAYPYGSYSNEVVEVLRLCGVSYCRTTVATEKFDIPTDWLRMPTTCRHVSERLGELTDTFLDKKIGMNDQPMLFYLWGHSYEFARDNNWELIETFAQKTGGKEDIWYATNTEVYEYVECYRSLIFSADMHLVYNSGNMAVWFCYSDKLYCVHAGETVTLTDR